MNANPDKTMQTTLPDTCPCCGFDPCRYAMNSTKPQHTPGPWHLRNESRYGAPVIEGEGLPLAEIYGDSAEQRAANARLIAQAPALAEALQAIVALQPECMTREAQNQFDHYTEANGHRVHLCRLLLKAREAAKAALAAAGLTGGGK